ncbi:M48 family metallopeptidase [Deinococcus yavapaiensis]|uniref:Zn-dependent protease with chaperone function n=1 Tax=Deinococcus yavapaiensis KR-236 TaxID=694435 RepID=A0A318SBU1_9DEIO|nr:M48 family metallopeptidase [Deinococcus yavapaiensis]PYE54754.1 Zn-dependent protease with chaperone function [Deinococcus yavapaiensis KR-236]
MHGVYFDGRTSKAHEATASVESDTFVVRLDDAEGSERRFAWKDVVIEPAMGRVRRAFVLRDAQRFETSDFGAVEALEATLGRNRGLTFVHRVESRWHLVLLSVAVFVVVTFAIWRYGLPILAGVAASLTPPGAMAVMDRQAARLLDEQLFEPTNLPADTRRRVRADFRRVVADLGGAYPYRLEFRDGGELGANALALPHGTIYVTDQLVKLAKNDRELEGVLAHEAGHVIRRHAMKGVYQSVGLFVLLSAVMGDVGTASTIAATIPTVLVNSGYSREMESDADDVGGRYLLARYRTTKPLQDLLTRLSEARGSKGGDFTILDSHPDLERRLKRLRALQRDAQRQP